jgi:hypothetical protein
MDDRERMKEITEYVNREAARREADSGTVHIHYHATPAGPAPVEQNPGQTTLDKYVPYFFVLLGGVVILACVGVIAVMLVPVLLTFAVTAAVVMGGFAVCCVAIAAMIKSLGQTRNDRKIVDQALRSRRRRR